MMKKKQKKTKSSIKFKAPVQSTQSALPIKDIYGGVVITEDGRYVKIIEVKPITFDLKSASDKNTIFGYFASALKIAPDSLQFTAMSFPTNLEKAIDILDKEIKEEENENCLAIDRAYRNKLIEVQEETITRRFFISFQYEGRNNKFFSSNNIGDIVWDMNNTAHTIATALKNCGNEIIEFDFDSLGKASEQTRQILYTILNRDEYTNAGSYRKRYVDVVNKYYDKEKNELARYIPSKEFIAPHSISYLNHKYIVVNNKTYYSFLYVPKANYPDEVYVGWTRLFINSYEGVDTNIFIERVPKEKVINDIRRNMVYSQTDAANSTGTSSAFDSSVNTYQSGDYLKEGLVNGNEDFYYTSLMITVTGASAEEVDRKVELLKQDAIASGMKLHDCSYFEEECFRAALPLCCASNIVWEKSKRNMLTEGVASTYPFTAFEMMDDNGIYFGDNVNNRSIALIDIFNTDKFQNPNVFICGQSGSGKTYSLLLMAIRMRIKHIPIFILAPEKEHEFRRVCTALGGQFIQIGAGSPNCINIMEIRKKDESVNFAIDGNYTRGAYLSEKIQTIRDFLELLIPDMNPEEKALLEIAIKETYYRFGITNDNNSLYDPEDIFHEKFRKMPILEDLGKVLSEKRETMRLSNVIRGLCMGSGESFNGQTNVDLSNDFTVIGLEHLTGDNVPLGIYMAMDFVWSKIKEDRTKRKALFVDEWWKLAINPVAANYSMNIAKTIRAYGGAMVLATQQMGDILAVDNGKFGEAVLENCKTKILLQMNKTDANRVQKLIGINDLETQGIQRATKGQALFVTNDNNINIQFRASKEEHDLITTDRSQLTKMMKQQSKQKEIEFEVYDAKDDFLVPDVDDIFDIAISDDEENNEDNNEDILNEKDGD